MLDPLSITALSLKVAAGLGKLLVKSSQIWPTRKELDELWQINVVVKEILDEGRENLRAGSDDNLSRLFDLCYGAVLEIEEILHKIRPKDGKWTTKARVYLFFKGPLFSYRRGKRNHMRSAHHDALSQCLQVLNMIHNSQLDEIIEKLLRNGHDTKFSLEDFTEQIRSLRETLALISDNDPLRNQISQTLESLEQTASLIRSSSILETLRFQEMKERYNSLNKAHRGTFSWLLGTGSTDVGSDPESSSICQPEQQEPLLHERKRFIDWLETGTRIFHISGKLGSGKSTLMKFICEHRETKTHLRAWCEGKPAGDPAGNPARKKLIRGTFFFWNEGSRTQRSRLGFIRAILYSILTQSPELEPLLFKPARDEDLLDFDYAFRQLIERDDIYDKHRIAIFIDALDECDGGTDRQQLTKELEDWASLRPQDLKICVSSREHSDVGRAFQAYPRITLQNHNQHGILSFVRDTLAIKDNYIQSATFEQRSRFEERIARESEGIFLWSKLVVEEVLRNIEYGYNLEDINRQIAALPKDLHNLFDKVFSNVVEKRRVEPLALIQMVACSPKPWPLLRLSFLPDYLKNPDFANCDLPDENKDKVAKRKAAVNAMIHDCQGLIEVRPSSGETPDDDVVVMAHRSLYGYFAHDELNSEWKKHTPDFEALHCLCQALLAELRCTRHDINKSDPQNAMRVVVGLGRPLSFGPGLPYYIQETVRLMEVFVQHWEMVQEKTRFYRFLTSFVDVYQHMFPSTTDSQLEFFLLPVCNGLSSYFLEFFLLLARQRIGRVCNGLSLCIRVLAACNGVPPPPCRWPDTEDWVYSIMEHLPFPVLVNLMINGTENPEAAVGLIEHVKLYFGNGSPLNEETNLPRRRIYQMSDWSAFFESALFYADRIDELRRHLPVFGLLLLHGLDPRTRFGVKLFKSERRRRLGYLSRRKDLCTDAIGLSINDGPSVSPSRFFGRSETLLQLREKLGESFTLSQLLDHLFPFGKGAIVCEMARWHLTLAEDLSAAEVAEMRRQQFESKVEEQLLTRDAIKKCFEGKDLD